MTHIIDASCYFSCKIIINYETASVKKISEIDVKIVM